MAIQQRDFRGLDENTQAEIRRQAYRNLDKGMSRYDVAAIAEVHYKTIGAWIAHREEIEAREFRGKKRGRTPGEQKQLTQQEEHDIKRAIEEKTPEQAGVSCALWTRKAIQALILKKTGKTMRLQTVSKYTGRWGLTPQRPAKYAAEQDEEKIREWLKEEYPKIVEKARKENAEIHWEDETGVSLSTFYARSYAKKGVTPSLRLPARRASLSMISSITNRGDMRFMLYRGALNTSLFLSFLKRLTQSTEKKIFLIVDNLQVHKSKKVKKWIEENEDELEIFFPASVRSSVQP